MNDEHAIEFTSQYLATRPAPSTPGGIVTPDKFWVTIGASLNLKQSPQPLTQWFLRTPSPERQTGRTTRLLDFAIRHNARFVVMSDWMIGYCQRIEPRMKRKMFVTINQIAERRAFCKNRRVVLDHSVVEYMNDDLCKQVHHEWEVLIPYEGEIDWRPTEMIVEDYYA